MRLPTSLALRSAPPDGEGAPPAWPRGRDRRVRGGRRLTIRRLVHAVLVLAVACLGLSLPAGSPLHADGPSGIGPLAAPVEVAADAGRLPSTFAGPARDGGPAATAWSSGAIAPPRALARELRFTRPAPLAPPKRALEQPGAGAAVR